MSGFLKRYRIKLETLTPIHIGSGQTINKKEYIYYRNNQIAWIPNNQKLLQSIISRKLMNAYEGYMLEGNEPLLNWMKSVGYSDKEIQSLCDYSLDCSYALDNLNRPVAISGFVKDAYGLPYIPGSSIKGAIRTALIGKRILCKAESFDYIRESARNTKDYINGKSNRKYLSVEGKMVEETAFHTLKNTEKISDAKNDELKGLIISDSKPLEVVNLTLCQKIDLRLDKKKNSLNILRECLKPGTIVEFEMTMDTTVFDVSADELEQALRDVYVFYQDLYVKKFVKSLNYGRGNLYLGGGTGYGTKTVAYELLDEKNRMRIVGNLMSLKFPKHAHRGDAKKGISPHTLKCTNYNGKLVEMGKCRIVIEEIQ